MALGLTVASVVGPSSWGTVAADSSEDHGSLPGPCEDGYVAPTPVSVAVSEVPVVVASTVADYFVLYVNHPNPGKIGNPRHNEVNPTHIAVSVTRGLEGTTVLRDNLKAVGPAKYRVEKYEVARPGDLDGDCVDDITELDDLGAYNPLNPAREISSTVGRVGIDSHESFEEISSLYATQDHCKAWHEVHIKFVIVDWLTSNPSVYFLDHSQADDCYHHEIIKELRRVGIDDISTRSRLSGTISYFENVMAPDGSLGVYVYNLGTKLPPTPYAGHMNQLLASALPFVENNLVYTPSKPQFESRYKANKAAFSAKRINVLLHEDIRPIADYMPLNQAEGFGRLRLMGPDDDDPRPHEIPVYESLPNDLPRVAGSITTVPQTPLSHVNLRAIQNGVPNAFIRDILKDEDLKGLFGQFVYFSVAADGFVLREALKAEVDEHHSSRRPATAQTLVRDLTVTGIASLADVSFDDWDAFGVKAANMAELSKLGLPEGTVPTGFAVPFYFYDEFMKNAGLADETLFGKKKWPDADKLTLPAGTKLSAVVTQILAHPRFQADYDIQEEMLDDLRDAIKDADSPDWIVEALEDLHEEYPVGTSLRYRSSTNNEDLSAFNGAGLYDSKTQDPDETTEDGIDKSIKAVWASLWNFRAFLERDYYRVDHKSVAMGVLVHPNFSDERVNGVAVSYDPVTFSPDAYYVNSQLGEDLVTNPEAKSHPEQLLLDSKGKATVLARSNLVSSGTLLMSDTQMVQLRNNLKTIHDRFKTLYNIQDGDRFAIEIEFKITADNTLAIKQARPWVFSDTSSQKPKVSVTAGTGVTEGGDAVFTVSAGPAPNAPLSVDVSVAQVGDFGVSVGSRTVTVPTSGSATVTVSTSDDDADEVDGSVSVTVVQDGDFGVATGSQTVTVPTSGSATVTVSTSDDSTDEVDGSVSVSVGGGSGYTVSSTAGSASVVVSDDDVPPVLGCGDTDVLGLEAKGNHDGLANTAANRKERNDWWRAWIALSGVTGTFNTPLSAAEAKVLELGDLRWSRFRVALECLEGTPPPATPVVRVTAGSGVTEGGDALFTVTVSPAPSSPLSVSVTVAQTGDFGATTGTRTVTVPTSGSATVTVSTSDDSTDETDGSVTVTANGGSGYTVSSSQGSASVDVADNDDPPPATPEVSVTAGSGITEGGDASFTVTASPAPSSSLSVSVTVAQDGDFGAASGSQTVAVPTSGSTTVTVSTSDDNTDETDGSVSVTVNEGSGYTVSSSLGSASVDVADNDDPPPTPVVSVTAGSGVTEGGDASFTVTANPAPSTSLSVRVTVSQQGDYGASTGSQTIIVPTSGTATVTVSTSDDSTDEADGSVTVTVNAHTGYTVSSSQGTAIVVVADNDVPLPVTPEISVTAGAGVVEGGDVSFTVTANPAPVSLLSVTVTVTQVGDFGVSTGSRSVTVPISGTATATVATSDDSTDEMDGSVTVTVNGRAGYTVSATQGSVTVEVADNDDPLPPGLPVVSVADGSVVEGEFGFLSLLEFQVTLSEPSEQDITVRFRILSGSAVNGLDYWGSIGQVTIWAGWTRATTGVNVRDDHIRERDETLVIELTEADGAVIADNATANGTIIDND